MFTEENKAVEQGPGASQPTTKNGNWKLRIVVMSWSIDKAKLDRVRTLMKDQDILRSCAARRTTFCTSPTTGA